MYDTFYLLMRNRARLKQINAYYEVNEIRLAFMRRNNDKQFIYNEVKIPF